MKHDFILTIRSNHVGIALERMYSISCACLTRLPRRVLDHKKQIKRIALVGPVQVLTSSEHYRHTGRGTEQQRQDLKESHGFDK